MDLIKYSVLIVRVSGNPTLLSDKSFNNLKIDLVMRRILFVFLLIASTSFASAQKIALIDMEYILKNIPAYEMANEQLSQLSKKWEAEVQVILEEVQTMYKEYQAEQVFLSAEMKKKKEDDIVAKEREAQELKRQYFGAEGELFKRREALMKPIQDEIYEAIKNLSEDKGYQLILDRASGTNIIFASPKIDISNEVLVKMGYTK